MQREVEEQIKMFGMWLADYLAGIPQYEDYLVHCERARGEPKLSVMEARRGLRGPANMESRLADVDVMVAKPNKDLVVLVQIETEVASPKRILGAVLAILMCNRLALELDGVQQYYKIGPETKFVLAGTMTTGAYAVRRIKETIWPRLQHFAITGDGIDPKNVIFVFRRPLSSTMRALRQLMELLFPQATEGAV